jgi:hypothetical protein
LKHFGANKIEMVRQLIHSQSFLQSVVICACEIQFKVSFVNDMQFDQMMEIVDQKQPFDLWRIFNILLNIYPDIPASILE